MLSLVIRWNVTSRNNSKTNLAFVDLTWQSDFHLLFVVVGNNAHGMKPWNRWNFSFEFRCLWNCKHTVYAFPCLSTKVVVVKIVISYKILLNHNFNHFCIYRITSNNSCPLIIPAPLKFQKKVSSTSNNFRPLVIPAQGTRQNYIGILGKLFLYF